MSEDLDGDLHDLGAHANHVAGRLGVNYDDVKTRARRQARTRGKSVAIGSMCCALLVVLLAIPALRHTDDRLSVEGSAATSPPDPVTPSPPTEAPPTSLATVSEPTTPTPDTGPTSPTTPHPTSCPDDDAVSDCGPSPSPSTTTTPPPVPAPSMATPTSPPSTPAVPTSPPTTKHTTTQTGAAGVCFPSSSDSILYEIDVDIPNPRCAIANDNQHLRVTNRTNANITVTLKDFTATLAPNQTGEDPRPFGSYLAPGLYVIGIDYYAGGYGPELLLDPDPSILDQH